jgi:hypothetical protein
MAVDWARFEDPLRDEFGVRATGSPGTCSDSGYWRSSSTQEWSILCNYLSICDLVGHTGFLQVESVSRLWATRCHTVTIPQRVDSAEDERGEDIPGVFVGDRGRGWWRDTWAWAEAEDVEAAAHV